MENLLSEKQFSAETCSFHLSYKIFKFTLELILRHVMNLRKFDSNARISLFLLFNIFNILRKLVETFLLFTISFSTLT